MVLHAGTPCRLRFPQVLQAQAPLTAQQLWHPPLYVSYGGLELACGMCSGEPCATGKAPTHAGSGWNDNDDWETESMGHGYAYNTGVIRLNSNIGDTVGWAGAT